MAYNRPVVISQARRPVRLAVDGSRSTNDNKCAETDYVRNSNTRAWWYVDLGSLHRVTSITLVNKRWGSYGRTRARELLSNVMYITLCFYIFERRVNIIYLVPEQVS